MNSIKYKLMFAVIVAFILVYIPTLAYVDQQNKLELYKSAENEAFSTAKIISIAIYRNYEIDSDLREMQSFLIGSKISKNNILELMVVNSKLKIVGSTKQYKLQTQVSGVEYDEALQNKYYIEVIAANSDNPVIRVVYPISLNLNADKVPSGAIELMQGMNAQLNQLKTNRRNIIVAGFLIILTMAVVTILFSHTITKPIMRLYHGLSLANQGDLNVRVEVGGRDEIGYATETFNQMLNSIQQSNKTLQEKSKELEILNKDLIGLASRLKDAERLEVIGTLTSVIAHQLKNPLSIISGAASAIQRRGEISQFQEIIEHESARTLKILDRFLEFAKKQNVIKQKVNLASVVDEVLKSFDARTHQIKILTELDREIDLELDRNLFQEVLLNILENARDSISERQNKEISIILKKISKEIYLEISDTGVGVNNFEKVFEPFFTTKAKGVGLGLSMARKIIVLHSGTLDIFNNINGIGATVSIKLPAGH